MNYGYNGRRPRTTTARTVICTFFAARQGENERAIGVSFSPNGALLAIATDDNTIELWDGSTGKSPGAVYIHGGSDCFKLVSFSPDGGTLASAGDDSCVCLWDMAAYEMSNCEHVLKTGSVRCCRATLAGHSDPVHAVVWLPTDSAQLATASLDRTVRIWSMDSGTCTATFKYDHIPSAVAWSPDGRTLAVVQTYAVWLCNPASGAGRPRAALSGHNGRLRSVAFRPDGARLATASDDNNARLFDVKSRVCLSVLSGNTRPVNTVAFSPNSRSVATGSNDKTVKMWAVGSGQCISTLNEHQQKIQQVAFHPSGGMLASAALDIARMWLCSGHQAAISSESADNCISASSVVSGRGASFNK